MSDPNYPPPPPEGTPPPPPPPPPPGGTPPPPPPPPPPGGTPPPPPGYPPQQPGYPPQQPGYPPQQPGYPPQQPGYPQQGAPGVPPPPPPAPGGYQPYNPGAGTSRYIPEINAYQDEPWKRIVARIIDAIILSIPGFILAASLLTVTINDCFVGEDCSVGAADYFLFGLISLAISAAYYIGFTAFMGATPGKMVFGLKVVQTNGQPPDVMVAARRWIIDGAGALIALIPIGAGRWLSQLALLGLGIYSVVLLFQDPRQQDLYDKTGDTYVVKK